MKGINWRHPKSRSRFFALLTVILVVCMFAHPELRLLAPVVDALGVDMLIALTSFQLIAILRQAWSSPMVIAGIDFLHSLLQLYDPAHWVFGSGFIGRFIYSRVTFSTARLSA
jgi:hypothetical protein